MPIVEYPVEEIIKLLKKFGHMKKVARALGISRHSLIRILQKSRGLCSYSSCQNTPVGESSRCTKHYELSRLQVSQCELRDPQKYKSIHADWERGNRLKRNARRRTEEFRKKKAVREKYLASSDVNVKLARRLRTRMNMALRHSYKSGSAVGDLGCSLDEFKRHLESKFKPGMTWETYGRGSDKWSIDHIKPLVRFNLSERTEFLKAAHYTNMQPLWNPDNTRKHCKV